MGTLDGRVAIVTAGGGPGMGRALCLALAKEGATVVVADLDPKRGEESVQAMEKAGGKAVAIQTDVSKKADVQRMVDATVKRFGRVSILLNHAGVNPSAKYVEEMPEELWDRALAVHLKGAFLCSQAVIPHMRKERWGRIVSTVSRAAFKPTALGLADYAAAKSGIVGFSRALAMEIGRYGITVNCIAPGLVHGGGMGLVSGINETTEWREKAVIREGQLVRPFREVTPEEIAGAMLYLVGPHADRVTGLVMHVNGGSFLPS